MTTSRNLSVEEESEFWTQLFVVLVRHEGRQRATGEPTRILLPAKSAGATMALRECLISLVVHLGHNGSALSSMTTEADGSAAGRTQDGSR